MTATPESPDLIDERASEAAVVMLAVDVLWRRPVYIDFDFFGTCRCWDRLGLGVDIVSCK